MLAVLCITDAAMAAGCTCIEQTVLVGLHGYTPTHALMKEQLLGACQPVADIAIRRCV